MRKRGARTVVSCRATLAVWRAQARSAVHTVLVWRRGRRVRAVGAIAAAALLVGCSGTPHSSAGPGVRATSGVPALRVTSAGYKVPARLRDAAPGTLISVRDAASQASRLGAARAWQLLYHSTDLSGHDIAVSALMLVPHGRPPSQGWPLIAWAHGTTGLADQCAPSIAPDLGHDQSAVREVRALLARRWAIVASDYPGLGTPGVHTFLIGQADATAVIDSVSAAHQLLAGQVSGSWITVGHSEGGQTALFVAQAADRRAARWHFLGTVALAPASTLDALIPYAQATHDPVEQAYMIYALAGLSTVDTHVHLDQLLTPEARPVLADMTKGCIDDIVNDLTNRHLDQLLHADPATITRLGKELGRYDNPDQLRTAEPILIAQGTADRDVPAAATDGLVSRLCRLGDHVEYRHYPGLDHNNLVAGSLNDVGAWITARFARQSRRTTCEPNR